MNRTHAQIVSVRLHDKAFVINPGQQIPCRYAGGVLADQGCEELLMFLV